MDRAAAERAILAAIPPDRASQAVAFIADSELAAGETVLLDRQPFVVPRPLFLGFIDLQPGANWGHLCRYVLCNVADDGVELRFGRFPPESGARRMVTLSVGPDVPTWARPRD